MKQGIKARSPQPNKWPRFSDGRNNSEIAVLSDLTPVLITEYRDRLHQEITVRGKPRFNESVRRYLSALSHMFSVAIKEFGWLQENPMGNGKVNKPKKPRGKARFLSDQERAFLNETKCLSREIGRKAP